MLNVTDLILVLLRGIAKGNREVLTNDRNEFYVDVQCKDFEDCKDLIATDIIERLQYELYGEFPLSYQNQIDWDNNISKALNLSDYYRKRVANGLDIDKV